MTDEQEARLNNVYNNREKAIADTTNAYNEMTNNLNDLKTTQDNYANQYETTQNEIADKNLAYQTSVINQQKQDAQKAYTKESNKALNAYQAYINPYGSQSETIGNAGLNNTGVSETMQLGAYKTYQNRVAQANSTLQTALTTYDQSLNEAIKDNDVTKAQNALTKLQTQLENAESYYNNSTSLTQNKLSTINSLNEQYDNQYNTVYNQILNEQEQAEAIREYNQNYAYQQQRDAIADAQWQAEQDEAIRQYNQNYAYQQQRDAVSDQQWLQEYNLSKTSSSSGSGSASGNNNTINVTNQTATWNDDSNNKITPQNTSDYYFKSTTGEDYQPRYVYDVKLEHATNNGTNMKLKNLGIEIKGISGNKNIWKGVDENGKTAYYVWDEDSYVDITSQYKSIVK